MIKQIVLVFMALMTFTWCGMSAGTKQDQAAATTYTYRTPQGNNVAISVVQGDITQQQFNEPGHSAVVNAANEQLAAGGGVCGAIFRAAGMNELTAACNQHPVLNLATGTRCPTGQARITQGCDLAPIRIIHAVGPIVANRQAGPQAHDAQLLTSAYQDSLRVGSQNNVHTVAFPSISTGIYGYDVNLATPVAVQAVLNFIGQNPGSGIQEVRFVTFDAQTTDLYRNQLENTGLLARTP